MAREKVNDSGTRDCSAGSTLSSDGTIGSLVVEKESTTANENVKKHKVMHLLNPQVR